MYIVFLVALWSSTFIDSLPDGGGAATERTLAMIKPDGVKSNFTGAIKEIIRAEGFKIVTEKELLFDGVAAESFYEEHSKREFFPQLVKFMTSGPVVALVLEKQNAIKDWRGLMGPTDSNKARIHAPNSLRAKFGLDGQSNCVHGSDSPEAAVREIAALFSGDNSVELAEVMTSTHDEL